MTVQYNMMCTTAQGNRMLRICGRHELMNEKEKNFSFMSINIRIAERNELMQIINCMIQVFMGAISGYYTNKLAISHLFTDISLPWGTWKAVIKKGGNKERLAEDLSDLAEDKIIGKQKQLENTDKKAYLYQELSKSEVLLALDQCVEEIFQKLEKSEIGQRSLTEIFENFLKENQVLQLLEEAFITMAADWNFKDFISEETFTKFFYELWEKELAPKLLGEHGLEQFFENLCRELGEEENSITLQIVLGDDICKKIEEVLLKKIEEILNAMDNDRDRMRMEGYLSSICRQIGIETVVREFLFSLQEKTLGEVLSISEKSWFFEKLFDILEQKEIQKSLQDLFEIFKQELIQSNFKLSDLLPENCLESEIIKNSLKEQLKKLQPFLSDLYEDNREFLSKRVAEELTTVINEGTGNFLQNMVLFSAKDMIVKKMQEFLKEKLPEKIKEFLEMPSEEFCIELCSALGNLPISALAEKLSFEVIFGVLKKSLSKKNDFCEDILKKAENISFAVFLTDDLIDSFSKKAEKKALLFLSNWLKGEEKKKQIEQAIHFLLNTLWEKPLQKKEMERVLKEVKKQALPEKLFTRLEQWIIGKKEKESTLSQLIYKKFSEIKVKEFFVSFIKKEQKTGKLLETIFGKYKNTITVGTMISMIPKESLKEKIRELFIKNAGNYISIKPVVKKKILALDEDMLCTMMQKFMGTQLRPLNRIGGALGAMIGFFLWLLNPSLNVSLPMVGLAILCYALVGIGTNILALRGLFRPYHPEERMWLKHFAKKEKTKKNPVMAVYHFLSKIPGIKTLFCLGYIPEKKEIIARQLSSFVADNFLKPEDLLPEIKITTGLVQEFLKNHKDAIGDYAIKKLWKIDWDDFLKQTVEKRLTQKEDKQKLCSLFWQEIEKKGSPFLAKIAFLSLQEIEKKTVGSYLSSAQIEKGLTKVLLKQIEQIMEKKEIQKEFLEGYYQKNLKEKEMGTFFLDEKEMMAQKMVNAFFDFLCGDMLFLWIKNAILKLFDSSEKQCITELFHGKVGELIEENKDALEMFFFRMLKQGCNQYLISHEEELVDKLDLEIQNMMDTMANMPLGGMAASMLGTKQLIAKVFHNLFIEPPIRDTRFYGTSFQDKGNEGEEAFEEKKQEEFSEKEEIVLQERLSDELFDKNEIVILEKIDNILETQIVVLTIERLEELLFAIKEEKGKQKEQARKDWVDRFYTKFAIWKQCRMQGKGIKQMQELSENLLSFAGTKTVGSYVKLVNNAFLEEIIWQKAIKEVKSVILKQAMEQACQECFQYLFTTYIYSDSLQRYLSVMTEDMLITMVQTNWKRFSSLPCITRFLSELVSFDMAALLEKQESSLSVLIKELCLSLKEKESVQKGCQKLILGGLETISDFYQEESENTININNVRTIMLELLDSINDAFHYQKENQAGLYKVADTVDFANIIYLAVMDMTDEQIEKLFKGFAGQYFFSLKLSGALGFIFGVPVFQWIAAIVLLGKELTEKKKED